MTEHHRTEDGYVPTNVRWIMKFINNIGFPIAVCIWLAYQQYTQGREMINTMNQFKEAIFALTASVDQQTKMFRHRFPQKRDDG